MFSAQFGQLHISDFMKISSVGYEVLYVNKQTDGRTDRQIDTTKLKVAFRYFANAPNNSAVQTLTL